MALIQELREKQARLVINARAKRDELKDGMAEADVARIEAEHDAMMAEYDALELRIGKEQKLLDAEAELNARDPRAPRGGDVTVDPAKPADEAAKRKAAFVSYLRYGADGLAPELRALLGRQRALGEGEQRAQGIVDATAGGYLVPEGFHDELAIALKLYGPMLDPGITREIATSMGNILPWPTMDDTANQGRRLAENTTVNPTTLAFGVKNLAAYKYTTDVVLVSRELLQDAAIDPEQIVRDAMAIRLGRVVNSDLTTGNGASQPSGIQFAASSSYTAASSTAVTFDDVIELEHSVDPLYRTQRGARFSFHDSTLKALRKLKDGDGQYIWQPASVVAQAPATILGYPYSINQAEDQIATGKRSMLFGDFQRYVVRRVREFLVRRLDERYADFDQVGFIGFGRYDGALVDVNAVKALVHP